MKRTIECLRCGRTGRNHGRSLCHSCYCFAQRNGCLDDYPPQRSRMPLEDLVEDYQFMRDIGVTHDEAAERLGMKRPSLNRALQRAKKAGLLAEVLT